jgi:hypothetical protein
MLNVKFTFYCKDILHKAGAGNYFRSRAILGFYLWLAGQTRVKNSFSKLKMEPARAGCGQRICLLSRRLSKQLQAKFGVTKHLQNKHQLLDRNATAADIYIYLQKWY